MLPRYFLPLRPGPGLRLRLPVVAMTGPAAHANGRAVTLAPLSLPARGDVSGWPQSTAPNEPEQARTVPGGRERRTLDGDTVIRVLAVAAFAAIVSYARVIVTS